MKRLKRFQIVQYDFQEKKEEIIYSSDDEIAINYVLNFLKETKEFRYSFRSVDNDA
jgi:hypothetical protein